MRKIKFLVIVPILSLVLTLTGCNFQRDLNTFWTHYTMESRNLNYLFSNNTRETQFMGNTITGLMETDRWGNLQPALADPAVFDRDDNSLGVDGFRQTSIFEDNEIVAYEFEFVIRTNSNGTPLQWVNYRGNEVADITANDWIAAARWILNPFNNSENVNIWLQLIDGVQDYRNKLINLQGQIVDANAEHGANHPTTQQFVAQFQGYIDNISDHVGIAVENREIDGITHEVLIFRSNGPLRFMPRSLTANAFFPVNGDFLEERGGFFARTYRDVLFNGGYKITSHARFNNLVMERNNSYWDVESVDIARVHMRFLATNDPSTQRVLFENNELDEFVVNMNDRVATERYVFGPNGQNPDNPFDQTNPYHDGAFARVEDGAFVRPGIFNFTRSFNPESAHPNAASLQNTQNALLVTEFRQSFVFGINWVNYIYGAFADSFTGYDWRTSMWTLPGLASTYAYGEERDYSWFFAREFMRMRMDEDGAIFGENNDPDNPDHVEAVRRNLVYGGDEDLVFFEDIAKRFITNAYNELRNEGVTFPILIEFPTPAAAVNHSLIDAQAAYIANFWNEVIQEKYGNSNFEFVRFEATQATSANHWSQLISGQFDFKFPNAGWGATVGDPIQYAAVFALEPNQGAWIARMGLSGEDNRDIGNKLLGHYTDLVSRATAETADFTERFSTFAEAEFHLLYEKAVVVPGVVDARQQVVVSRILPYTQIRDPLGISHRMRKHQIMLPANITVTRAQGEALRQAWESGDLEYFESVIESIMQQFR